MGPSEERGAEQHKERLFIGGLALDLAGHSASLDGRALELTALEFSLLAHLASHLGWVFSPEQLLREVWGYDYVQDVRVVYTHIGNLRHKLGDSPSSPRFIQTVRGVGYKLVKSGSEEETPGGSRAVAGRQPVGGRAALPDEAAAQRAAAQTAIQRTRQWGLIGREQELAILLDALDQARVGLGSVALVLGEPGVGKTRLAEELAERAAVGGTLVLRGHCPDTGLSSHYWPWAQILRSLVAAMSEEEVHSDLRYAAAELAVLLPEIRGRFPDLPPAAETDLVDPRSRFLDAAIGFVLGAARSRTLVLAFYDLQFGDLASLLLLEMLAPELPGVPILVVGTAEDQGLERDHPFRHTLAALEGSGCRLLKLGALSREETRELITQAAGVPTSEAAAERIYQASEGNPLFAVELARLLEAEHQLDGGSFSPGRPLPLPRAVHDTIGRRLAGLSSECRSLLGLAALAGRSFQLQVLTAASGLAVENVLETLDEAAEASLVAGTDTPGEFRFTHVLLRDFLEADLGDARRLALHARLGEAYERLFEPAEVLDRLAYHFYCCAPLGYGARAVEYLNRAGLTALRQYGFEAAEQHFRSALAVLPLSQARVEERQLVAVALQEGRGDALHLGARASDAVGAYERGLTLVSPRDRLSRARLERKMGAAWQASQEPERALELLEASEGSLGLDPGSGDPDLWQEWIEIQLQRLEVFYFTADLEAMGVTLERALPEVELYGTAEQRAQLRSQRLAWLFRQERYLPSDYTLEYAREQWDTDMDAPELARRSESEFQLGFALLWHGRLEEAERHLRQALALGERYRDRRRIVLSLTYLAATLRMQGRVGDVRTLADRLISEAAAAGLLGYVAAGKGHSAWVALRDGDGEAAERQAREALEWWRSPSAYPFEWFARWPLLNALLERGDVEAAVDEARGMLLDVQQKLPDDQQSALSEAMAARGRGDREGAGRALKVARTAAAAGWA
jgi:eukaryotic-like serine/threonine-protein kinase